jgi:hypothetical protein
MAKDLPSQSRKFASKIILLEAKILTGRRKNASGIAVLLAPWIKNIKIKCMYNYNENI